MAENEKQEAFDEWMSTTFQLAEIRGFNNEELKLILETIMRAEYSGVVLSPEVLGFTSIVGELYMNGAASQGRICFKLIAHFHIGDDDIPDPPSATLH
jgi:hypothetical protein